MSNSKSSNTSSTNNSFSHAFLPGLILGLIIGGVAGTLVPEFMGGPKLPANRGMVTGDPSARSEQGGERDSAYDAETQQAIDDAINQVEDDAGEVVDEAIDENALPEIPTSDD